MIIKDENEEQPENRVLLQKTSKRQQKSSNAISDQLMKYFEKMKEVYLHHWVGYKRLLGILHRCNRQGESSKSSQPNFSDFLCLIIFLCFCQ